jgi:hypothetical protein
MILVSWETAGKGIFFGYNRTIILNQQPAIQAYTEENSTMKTTFKSVLSVTLGILLATSVYAGRSGEIAEWPEVRNCVAAVDERIDLDNAMRVRHEITEIGDARVGIALTIRTSVIRGGGASNYSTRCIASGHYAPMRLQVSETVD